MAMRNREYVELYHSSERMTALTEEIYRGLFPSTVNIAVGGYYGFGNMGDETLLDTLIEIIREAEPKAAITVLYKKHGVLNGARLLPRYSPISVIRTLASSDIFVLGGGSILQNETSRRSLMYYGGVIVAAKLLGCRCLLLSNGIGPVNGLIWRRLTAFVLFLADGITLRDRASERLVSEISQGRISAELSADLCFLKDLATENNGASEGFIRRWGNYAVIALNGRGSAKLSEIKEALESNGLFGVFVAMDGAVDRHRSEMGARICGGVFFEDASRETIIEVVRGARVVMGERLHALVFASLVGSRFLALGDSVKVKSFFEERVGNACQDGEGLSHILKETLELPLGMFDADESRKMAKRSSIMLRECIRKVKKSKKAKKIIKST